MLKRDWATCSRFINYATLNSEHNWEDLYSDKESTKHAFLITLTKSGEVQSSIQFLLVQVIFFCVNVIGKIGEHEKQTN